MDSENVKNFTDLDANIQKLIRVAIEARQKAYCPYSGFAVGAAIEMGTGQIFYGCNVENGAFSSTICAERTAMVKAISEGYLEIKRLVVVAFQEKMFTTPCGVCRQFLSEFATKDFPVYVTKPDPAQVLVTSLCTLLPHSFQPDFLMANDN